MSKILLIAGATGWGLTAGALIFAALVSKL
jgi:hypothetical protein